MGTLEEINDLEDQIQKLIDRKNQLIKEIGKCWRITAARI